MVAKDSLKTIGLTTTIICLIFSLGALILTFIDYNVVNVNWNNSPWRHIGILQLTSTIYTLVVSILGILVFTCCSSQKPYLLIVSC